MKRTVEYFDQGGPPNTDACIEIVSRWVKEGGRDAVVASTSGQTARKFSEALKGSGVNLVIVTHSVGFKEPGRDEFDPEIRRKVTENGARIYTGTILTHSLETGLSKQFSGIYPTMLIATSLRRLGEGTKVCCEIVMEACDAGLIEEGREVIAAAGTGHGADTVLVLRAAASKRFTELRVLEVLAKPRDW